MYHILLQNGFTPLYMAAQEGHVDVVRTLLTKGANQQCTTEVSDQHSFKLALFCLVNEKITMQVLYCSKKTALTCLDV